MKRLNSQSLADLEHLCPGGVVRNISLTELSWWRIGGVADLVLRPSTTKEIASLLRWFTAKGIRPVVIGQTTNLLFDDAGLRVPCIQLGRRMAGMRLSGRDITAQAGVWVPGLARRVMQAGLTGVEHVCGIPGTLGGLVCMNGGSKRKGIGSHIVAVESVTPAGAIVTRDAEQCGFAYRTSIYQINGEVITGARLRLDTGSRAAIRSEMRSILADRRRKFPRKEPNCGSVFKSNPTMYAEIGPPGAAIERLGFKGMRIGGALVSSLRANFIVNAGGASSGDVLALIATIARAVEDSTGYRMEVEACHVTPDGIIRPADTIFKETCA